MNKVVTCAAFVGLWAPLCWPEGALAGDGNPGQASTYFGQIEAPCAAADEADIKRACQAFRSTVAKLFNEGSGGDAHCRDIDTPCDEGEQLLKQLFGTTYRRTLPDFIVYLEQPEKDNEQSKKDKKDNDHSLKKHPPVLMWQGRNTPHLLGVRSIYVIVLSEDKADVTASVTSDFQRESNPLVAILNALGAPDIKAEDAKASETKREEIKWSPLSGNRDTPGMWFGIARLDVGGNSINRVTVAYAQPHVEDVTVSRTTSKDGLALKLEMKGGDVPESDSDKDVRDVFVSKDKYQGDFLAATGHFSNSPASRTGVSVALGGTFNTEGTSIASGGGDQEFNGYVFAKFYLSPPYLYAAPRWTLYKPSFGLAIGTNVKEHVFNEIVTGVALGHIVGNVGVIAGANFLAGKAGTTDGRKARAFLGIDYTF